MNADVHEAHVRWSVVTGASRFLIGLVTCFSTHDGIPSVRHAGRLFSVGAGRHADQFGESRAERAQRRAPDREADLGDGHVAATQQRHRPLDASSHEIGVRRLAIGEFELAGQVACRHVHAAGERLDVQRLGVLAVHPVAHASQQLEVPQALILRGCAGHLRIVRHVADGASSRNRNPLIRWHFRARNHPDSV